MNRILLPILVIGAIGAAIYFFSQPSVKTEQVDELTTVVKKGAFQITVKATGELNAKRSIKIKGPAGMRSAGIFETTLSDLVTEGTIIKKGDYVATLDRTELANKMSTVQNELDKIQTQLEQAKIDTAIELKGLRDEMINMKFTKQEKLLKLDENRYEPQSVIKAAELDLERSERDFNQLVNKYDLKKRQSVAKIEEILTLQRQNQMQMDRLVALSNEFTIMAPESGMLIYARTWRGKKEPGARISAWDPVVAELPDLSDMISKTYVNEIDISKILEGQEAIVKVDAFPDKTYSGNVIKVANIGEQLRGYDAKVFEVIVQVNEIDSVMRPAMTTSIEIVTNTFDDVAFIPLEALFSDSLSFVYKKVGRKIVKQEVIVGLTNDTEIIIDYGLEPDDEILLTPPANDKEVELILVDASTKAKILKEQQIAEGLRRQEAQRKKALVKDVPLPENSSGGGGDFIIIN